MNTAELARFRLLAASYRPWPPSLGRARMTKTLVLVGMLLSGTLGCGGEEASIKAGVTNKKSAIYLVSTARATQVALENMRGNTDLVILLMQLAFDGASLVVEPPGTVSASQSALLTPGTVSGTVDCTTNGCVYDKFTEMRGQERASIVVDGSVTSATSGDVTTVTCDVSVSSDNAGAYLESWRLAGTVDISPTRVSGALRSTALDGAMASLEYRDVLALPMADPTGGSVYAKMVDARGKGYDGTVTFP